MVINPDDTLALNLYADADYAGLWGFENPQDLTCVHSWTGLLLTLGDVPVLWLSKLQGEIALSTMVAEYIALLTGMLDESHVADGARTEKTEALSPTKVSSAMSMEQILRLLSLHFKDMGPFTLLMILW